MAYDIAAAAGEINQKEIRFLDKMCQRLNVPATFKVAAGNSSPSTNQSTTAPKAVIEPAMASTGPSLGRVAETVPSVVADQRKSTAAVVVEQISVAAVTKSSTGRKPSEEGSRLRPDQLRVVLEIDIGVTLSADLVARHYNRLMERLAPEKAEALGAEFVQMAQQKRQEIEQAARLLIAQWNEELIPKIATPVNQDLRHNPDLDALFGA